MTGAATCPHCGYTTTARTENLRAYALRRHSCEKQREVVARGQRRLDRLATAGDVRDCTHPARHQHGTRAAYVLDRCRCLPCKVANREGMARAKRAKLYGRGRLVDAGPVRAHVQQLQAEGMGWKRIARAAGVHTSTVGVLLYGRGGDDPRPPRKQISRGLAEKLLAVRPDPALLPSVGVRRRLQALIAIGWNRAELCRRLDIQRSNFDNFLDSDQSSRATTAKVGALFSELWDRRPPEDRWARASRAYAASRGWAPPAAWDDIDDPDEVPKGVGVAKATTAQRIRDLHELGETDREIAARLRKDLAYVHRILQESA